MPGVAIQLVQANVIPDTAMDGSGAVSGKNKDFFPNLIQSRSLERTAEAKAARTCVSVFCCLFSHNSLVIQFMSLRRVTCEPEENTLELDN